MGLSDNRLPLSVQLSGPLGSDALLLDIAEQIEAIIPWDNKPLSPWLGNEAAPAKLARSGG